MKEKKEESQKGKNTADKQNLSHPSKRLKNENRDSQWMAQSLSTDLLLPAQAPSVSRLKPLYRCGHPRDGGGEPVLDEEDGVLQRE